MTKSRILVLSKKQLVDRREGCRDKLQLCLHCVFGAVHCARLPIIGITIVRTAPPPKDDGRSSGGDLDLKMDRVVDGD